MTETADPQLRTARSSRAVEIVAAARAILAEDGIDALTMRRLGDDLGMRAPSLYKHFPDKAAVKAALVEEVLAEAGEVLHAALARPGRLGPVESLLRAYRRHGTTHPNLYRLATTGPLARDQLPPGLEDWAGEPFLLVTGDPHRAQALWALAHGLVLLEIDRRTPDQSQLDTTWRAAATAFASR